MVEALLLVSPGISGWAFDDPLLARRQVEIDKAAEAGDLDGVTEGFLRSWTDGPKRQPGDVDPAVRERVGAMARANVGTNGRGRVEEVGAVSHLGEIHVPTLVVLGELDMADIHGVADLVAAEVPGARQLVVPGVAHMVNMERPAEFNRILLHFLQASAR